MISQIKAGITIGVSSFSMNSDFYESKPNTGFDIGSHLRYILTERSEILSDFIISFSGSKIEGTSTSDISNRQFYKFKQTSINYGIYYNHYIIHEKFSVFLGPSFIFTGGLKLKEDNSQDDLAFGKYNINAETISENNNTLNLSTGITAGINDLRLILKYTYGLSNAYAQTEIQDPNNFQPVKVSGKISHLSLSLLYSIDI